MTMMRAQQWMLEAAVLSLAAVWLCLSKPTDKTSVLLPPSVVPEHYDLSLAPRVDLGVFFGVVVITGQAVTETDVIVLHCKSLVFNQTTVTDLTADGEDLVEVDDIQEDIILQQCHLHLNQSLIVDHEYRLRLEFMGIIGKDGVGLYSDFYMEGGIKHDILLTNVQPNFARALFPCFDEPHYKAQFLLRVGNVGLPTALSNMPVSTVLHSTMDPEEDNSTWVEFEETPPMSTYHMVIVLCDYLALSDSTTNSSIWAPRSRLHEAQLALNISVQALRHCERFFNMAYSLPKLDHIPLTSLNSVAMENWGAITYKKDFLLWEEGVSTWAQKEMVSHVVTHEVIHQWVGNLVTTAWWNTTWLNEGVTSFFHFYIMDKIEPSWNAMDTTFVMQIQQILTDEALRDLKPLTNNEPLRQDAVFSQVFTASTYLKGAAIIRMVYNLMPSDVFRDAIEEYISDNAYGAVDEGDLWQVLAAVTDLPEGLEAVMYSWTHQPGFPLVSVHRSADGCISVTQSKYVANEDESDVRWTIPLTYTTSSELDFNVTTILWFPEDQDVLDLGECLEPGDWVIINIRQAGYYRVNYDPETWRALTHDLMNCDLADIHPVNRAQLLHDGLDLARHGLLDYPVVLDLTRYLVRETEYLPWVVAVQGLTAFRARLLRTQTFPHFQRYALSLVEAEFSRMSLTKPLGDLLPELHRRQIVEFACTLRHPRCVKEATDMAYLLMSGVDVSIPLDLKPVLMCAAVRHGQDEVWHYVLKQYRTAAENDRWKYLVALACSSDRSIAQRILKDVANPLSFVKSAEERLILLMEIGKQDDALEDVLDMVLKTFNDLAENFDFGVILNLLKSFMKPTPTKQEKNMISKLNFMVGKTLNSKHIEIMESIMKEIDKPDHRFLHEEPVRLWFSRVVQEQEEVLATQTPALSTNSHSEIDPGHPSNDTFGDGMDADREGTTQRPQDREGTPHLPTSSRKGNTNKSFSLNPSRSCILIFLVFPTKLRLFGL